MEKSAVLSEQPDVSLAIRPDIGHVFDRMVVYYIIIGEAFLYVLGADHSVTIAGASPQGMGDNVLRQVVIDGVPAVTMV